MAPPLRHPDLPRRQVGTPHGGAVVPVKRPRQRREGLSPVERAQLKAYMAKDVRETFTAAQIHAMVGDDSAEMVNKAGRMR